MSPDSTLVRRSDQEDATSITQLPTTPPPTPLPVAVYAADSQTLKELERSASSKQETLAPTAAETRDPAVLRARRRRPVARGAQVRVRQQWVGRVESVSEDAFVAHLRDANAVDEPTEELAELLLDEVSEDQLDLVAPGRVFYWTIGYRTEPHGQRSSFSSLHFRRHLPLPEAERSAASDAAAEMSAWLRTDSS